MKNDLKIKQNIKQHDKVSGKYEEIHHEIFNRIEQDRLQNKLSFALQNINTESEDKIALDYGCGSGNLTSQLIKMGINTYAADVSSKFLKLVSKKHFSSQLLQMIKLNGKDMSNVDNNTFDIVLAYSVLHHIPDYLFAINEMIRVLKKGGVMFLDHERPESFWTQNKTYLEYSNAIAPNVPIKKSWKRFFKTSEYSLYFHKKINPRYKVEGDIHVWPDDHIVWEKIKNLLQDTGCEIVLFEEYLHFNQNCPENVFSQYKDKCQDMALLIAIKK